MFALPNGCQFQFQQTLHVLTINDMKDEKYPNYMAIKEIALTKFDKEFVLDILKDMIEVKEVYGLVVMDRRDAMIAYLKGKSIIPLIFSTGE